MGGGKEPCTRIGEMGKGSWRRLRDSYRRAETSLNRAVAESLPGRYFKLDARKTSFTNELRAGLATFLTMAYIISVNSSILTASGGPCSVADCTPTAANSSLGPECKFDHNPGYEHCLARTKSDLVVATILTAAAGCFAMGALANLPLAIAPAMGANAYFTYTMVGFHGSGPLPYGAALAAVLLEACLFLALSALGLRGKLARMIPRPIRLASAAGIGLFLAFTGLQAQQGVGLVGPSPSTLVTLAACARTDPVTGACFGGTMRSPTFWLGAGGFVVTAVCLAKDINGGMIYGIVFVTVISWFRGTAVTFFPATPTGDARFAYFKRVVDFHVIERTAGRVAFTHLNRGEFWISLATLLYVDVLDTTGSMYSMAEYGGFTDEKGRFEGEYRAFMVDAGATVVSTALGGATATTFLESTAGMREGGRTGVTAVATGVCFVASLFLTPVLTSVPPWAVGPALVAVGAMMMRVAGEVEWREAREAVPAFLTMLLMPLTYSIANGIIAGLGVYVAMGAYDHVAGMVRWVAEARRVMSEARNQVSADANDAPPPAPV